MAKVAQSQNIPDLNAVGPSGGGSSLAQPPALNANVSPALVRYYIPKVPITDPLFLNPGSAPSDVQIISVYKDGFGRTVQSVQHNASSGSNPHLVQPFDTRFTAEEHTFLPYPSNSYQYSYNQFLQQFSYIGSKYPHEGYTGGTITRNISGPSQRGTKTFAPGLSQVGQNRGITIKQQSNAAGEVKAWTLDTNGMPVSNSTYQQGVLFTELAFDTSGAVAKTFRDLDGNIVCHTVKQDEKSVQGGGVIEVIATTYYVYDAMKRLVVIIPPKAAVLTGSNMSTQVFQNLCFHYKYDNKGRLASEHIPGRTGQTEYVYDLKDRLVMLRSPEDSASARWKVNFYDHNGRVKAKSLLTSTMNRESWQNLLDAASGSYSPSDILYYLKTPEGELAYPGISGISNNSMLNYYYFDDYSMSDPGDLLWDAATNSLVFSEFATSPGAEIPVRSDNTFGMVTGTLTKILPAPGSSVTEIGEWRKTCNYYDAKGRVLFIASQDVYNGSPVRSNYFANQFDFLNRVLTTKHVIGNYSAGSPEHVELTRNYYDDASGKLVKTLHLVDTGIWVTQSVLSYDEVGKVKRKVLGDYGEVQDYSYNIRGQLSGINEYYTKTGDRQGESRSFGEILSYDYGFTQPRVDGKIAGMVWRGAGSSLANAYGYSYDFSGRLVNAEYRRFEPPSGSYFSYAWRKDLSDYTVSNLKYDLNGNILQMDQRAVKPGGALVTMDSLRYYYDDGEASNRLLKIIDSSSHYFLGDFNNTNGTSNDYLYDNNGNLVQDNNKGISGVTYNHLDKPVTVNLSGNKSVSYSYTASGDKVQEIINDNGNVKKHDYIGNFVFENDELRYASTDVGRSIFDSNLGKILEEYFVKDHIGNIRSVVQVYVPPVQEYLGTYEIASANLEGLFFDHHGEIRDDKPGGVPGDNQAGNLNGAHPDRRIGTSMLLHVMAGDKIEMNVNNYYERYESDNDDPVSVEDMLSTIISTLRDGPGGWVGSETHNIKTVTDVFNANNFSIFDQVVNNTIDNSKPKAFLNYILFDENMQIYPGMSGAFQANGEGSWSQIGTSMPLELPVNGYLAIYLSNASQNISVDEYGNVYFDQLVIRFSRGKLMEEQHYYPHGLPMAAVASVTNGYVANRKKYQGKEYSTDLGLNWMDFMARQYDPQIGRFLNTDPSASSVGQQVYSPYTGMANAPESMVDPDGNIAIIGNPSDVLSSIGILSKVNTLFGAGNYKIGKDGEIIFTDLEAAIANFNAFVANGDGGGSAASKAALIRVGSEILRTHNDPNALIEIGIANNDLSIKYRAAVEEVVIEDVRPPNALRRWLKRGDDFVTGHHPDNYRRMNQEGGIQFTSKTQGTGHSNYTATHPDDESVPADGLLRMIGNLYTSGFAMSHPAVERLVNLTSSADNADGARENAGVTFSGGVEYDNSTKKSKTYEIKITSSNSVSSSYDKDTDTTGLGAAMQRTLDSMRAERQKN